MNYFPGGYQKPTLGKPEGWETHVLRTKSKKRKAIQHKKRKRKRAILNVPRTSNYQRKHQHPFQAGPIRACQLRAPLRQLIARKPTPSYLLRDHCFQRHPQRKAPRFRSAF